MPPKDIFSGTQPPIGKAVNSGGVLDTTHIGQIDPGLLASLTADAATLFPGNFRGVIRKGQPDEVTFELILRHPFEVVSAGVQLYADDFKGFGISASGAVAGHTFQLSFGWVTQKGSMIDGATFNLAHIVNETYTDAQTVATVEKGATLRVKIAGDDLLKAQAAGSDGCNLYLVSKLSGGHLTNIAIERLSS